MSHQGGQITACGLIRSGQTLSPPPLALDLQGRNKGSCWVDMSSLYFLCPLDHSLVSEHLLINSWLAEEPHLLWCLFQENSICTASVCFLSSVEVVAWTWESKFLALIAVLLGLVRCVFSLHSPSNCCRPWEGDLCFLVGCGQSRTSERQSKVKVSAFYSCHIRVTMDRPHTSTQVLSSWLAAPSSLPSMCGFVTFRPRDINGVLPVPTHSGVLDPLSSLTLPLPMVLSTAPLSNSETSYFEYAIGFSWIP